MKLFSLALLLFTTFAQADELLCASKADQDLYFTTGQVRLTAVVNNETSLDKLVLTTTGSTNLGVKLETIAGQVAGNYSRFFVADAWCNYRITLPLGFMQRERTPLFMDAFCEGNSKYAIRLNCAVR